MKLFGGIIDALVVYCRAMPKSIAASRVSKMSLDFGHDRTR